MNELSPQERIEEQISAYLDGELSADGAASVEQLLTDRDDLRRLHDEMLAVRARLKALYRHRLDADFSEHVLRRAERAVLSRPASQAGPPADESIQKTGEASDNGAAPSVRLPRPFSNARSWLWAGVAVAAAVVLYANQPGEDELQNETATVRQVAKPQSPLVRKTPQFAAESPLARPGSADGGNASRIVNNRDGKTLRGGQQNVPQYDFLVSGQVAQSGVIEQLLANNQIVMKNSRIGNAKSVGAADARQPRSLAGGPTNIARRQFDVIYVEGSPRQIEAILSDLRSQAGVSQRNAPDEKAADPADGAGARKLADDAAPLERAAKKAKLKSTFTVGQAWRDAREARSLTKSYYNRHVPKAAWQKKVDGDSGLDKGDKDKDHKKLAAAKQINRPAPPIADPAKDAPALVTVKLVLRLVDPPAKKPPVASTKPGD